MSGVIEMLEGWAPSLAMLWLGGILLCAAPYVWALCRAASERAGPVSAKGPMSPAGEDEDSGEAPASPV